MCLQEPSVKFIYLLCNLSTWLVQVLQQHSLDCVKWRMMKFFKLWVQQMSYHQLLGKCQKQTFLKLEIVCHYKSTQQDVKYICTCTQASNQPARASKLICTYTHTYTHISHLLSRDKCNPDNLIYELQNCLCCS